MIREIKYVCTMSVDYFTCHALFSRITDGALSKLKLNSHSKQPQYKVYFQDRTITMFINDQDIDVIKDLPVSIEFNHKGKILKAILVSDLAYNPNNKFQVKDFVFASGIVSYATNISNQPLSYQKSTGEIIKKKHQSPINPFGNILKGKAQELFDYLEKKIGLDLNNQINERSFRFEMLSYKNFETNYPVYSKSNNNKISFHNVFSFELQAYVKNANIVNSLEYTSIGKKRSYGFGNVYIGKYE